MTHFVRFTVTRIIPPAAAAVALVALWSGAIHFFQIKAYLAPTPSQVASVLLTDRQQLFGACWLTGKAALAGLSISTLVGTAIGMIFSQSAVLRYSLFPYVIFLQTVPIVAIAPLLVMWFGYGTGGVIAVAFILSLFPIIANVTAGMTEVPRSLIELFRLYKASRWQEFVKLQLPHAIPNLITGIKTSSGLSVIGAIVGEFFVGYGGKGLGLGYLIRMSAERLQSDRLFAAVLLSTMLGVVIFATVSFIAEIGLGRWRRA